MEEKRINERESLQTIEEMLQATKSDDVRGIRASFRIWGSACILLGLATFIATSYFASPWWNTLWFLLFLVPLIPAARGKSRMTHVTTYLEESVSKVLGTMLYFFAITSTAFIIVMISKGVSHFQLMAPLSVIIASYTAMQIWSMAKQRGYFIFSLTILIIGVFNLSNVVLDLPSYSPIHHLLTGALLGLLFVVPGSFYNKRKERKL